MACCGRRSLEEKTTFRKCIQAFDANADSNVNDEAKNSFVGR